MKNRIIQYACWSLILVLTTTMTQAQSLSRTAYFMDNATHRHLLNPALVPARGYFSFPVVGAFSLGIESNMAFTDFIFPRLSDTDKPRMFLDKNVSADEFLAKIDPNNYLRMEVRTSFISMGFYHGTGFWTFDVASRLNMDVNLPKDLFAFAKVGMEHTAGDTYHLGGLSLGTSMFAEVSLGYSKNLMNNLRVGTKVKFLGGGARIRATIEQMDIAMSSDQWSVTTDGRLDVYGKGLILEKDEDGSITGVDFDSPGMGGKGLALDLGVNYSPIKNLDLSLAIVDLGGIKWKKENILSAGSSGSVNFGGLDGLTADTSSSTNISDQLENLQDDLTTMADFKERAVTENFLQKLAPTINAGVEYSMLKNKVSVGGLYSMRMMEDETYTEMTGSLNLRPVSWFNLSGSYSCLHGKEETFGFALGFVPALVNIFLSCDYVFLKYNPQYIPLNTMTTNFQLGVSIPLGRGRLPEKH